MTVIDALRLRFPPRVGWGTGAGTLAFPARGKESESWVRAALTRAKTGPSLSGWRSVVRGLAMEREAPPVSFEKFAFFQDIRDNLTYRVWALYLRRN